MRILFLIILSATFCYAQPRKVTDMTDASALTGAEYYYTVQGGADRKSTPLQLSTYVNSLYGSGVSTWLTTPSSANLISAVTDETGTGSLVFSTSPAFTTPNLGTPSAVTLTNGIGLPISTGVSGLGTGVGTFLGTPSWTNFNSMITGTAPYWPLTGTGTLTGNVIINGSSSNGLTFSNLSSFDYDDGDNTIQILPFVGATFTSGSGFSFTVGTGAIQNTGAPTLINTGIQVTTDATSGLVVSKTVDGVAFEVLGTGGGETFDVNRAAAGDFVESHVKLFTSVNGARAAILLGSTTSDPTSNQLDGDIWYRSDTHKFSGRANGTVVRFATEAWVNSNTVTSITLTQPAAGLTLTNTGVSQQGSASSTFALANDLAALEGMSGTGIVTRTGAETYAQRTITAGAGILVTNGDAVSGNPTIAIDPSYPQSTTISISSAEILVLNSSPKELIAAPGAGKFIQIISISSSLDFISAAYATNIDVFFRYGSGGPAINSGSWNIAQTADEYFRFALTADPTGTGVSQFVNQPIVAQAQTGNPTTGDGTAKVYITYRIVDL